MWLAQQIHYTYQKCCGDSQGEGGDGQCKGGDSHGEGGDSQGEGRGQFSSPSYVGTEKAGAEKTENNHKITGPEKTKTEHKTAETFVEQERPGCSRSTMQERNGDVAGNIAGF